MLELEMVTKDLSVSLPILAGVSDFDVFNSGPKKLVDAMFFFFLENNRVIGVKDPMEKNDKILNLKDWIITLSAHMIEDNGLHIIKESKDIISNARGFVSDLDASSAYPSATRACNVSKSTTHRELIKIENMTKEEFMLHNINLMFSYTNSLEYAQQMFKMPSLYKALNEI